MGIGDEEAHMARSLATFLVICVVLAAAVPVSAEVISAPSRSFLGAIFELVSAAVAALCLLVCFKLSTATKGGEVATGWQVAAGAFLLFTFGELAAFLSQIGALPPVESWVALFRVAAIGAFFWALTRMRKVFST
jgi:hypothetical protein